RKTHWFTAEVGGNQIKALVYLLRHLKADAQRDAQFVTVSMTCGVAQEAAKILNRLAAMFVESEGADKRGQIQEGLANLEERANQVQQELDKINDSLDQVRTKWGITDLGQASGSWLSQHPTVVRLNQLLVEENELTQTISQMESTVRSLEAAAQGPVNEQVGLALQKDPILLTLAQQIANAEAQLAAKLTKFGPQHREVQRLTELIKDLQDRKDKRRAEIAEQTRQAGLKEAQQELLAMKDRLATLQSQRQEAEAQKKDLDMARMEYERLVAVRDERIKTLNDLKQAIERQRLSLSDPKTPRLVLKAPALPPLEMVFTRQYGLWLPLGTLAGLFVALVGAFGAELMTDRIRTAADLIRWIDVPLLGIIPDAAGLDLPADVDLYKVVQQAPDSILADSYRRLRANLELQEASSILVTCSDAGDGSTSIAANLAIALAVNGRKVLLLDANLRHPQCASIFPRPVSSKNGNGRYGLSNVLLSQCTIRQAIRKTTIKGLDLMETGLLPFNPADLLASPKMKVLLSQLAKAYDHIIIDSPPILLVSDAKVIAQVADATLVVFGADTTRRGQAIRMLEELRVVRAQLAGCVLFGARALTGGYYKRGFRSYRNYVTARA
ncbi:MAG: polysaccharide biosynthesis tyrosine autokinase, partial [Sedimentisphaerales bacterium]|nr:polysaccharide biosynthesis tyrosine autokinase [Sedimentisphaerales bacterium]